MNKLRTTTLDRFDTVVLTVITALILSIVGIVMIGDRAGISVLAFVPDSVLHTTSPLRFTFSEVMKADSVQASLKIIPSIDGTFSWSGVEMIFKPKVAWQVGTTYTVSLAQGALAQSGRQLTETLQRTFTVLPARIVYLSPAVQQTGLEIPNLWIASPDDVENPRQLTNLPLGVVNFRPSPDGTSVAYAARTAERTVDLYVIHVDTGETRRLTRCIDAICQSPDWSADGTRVAYERIELNSNQPIIDQGAARTWIVNVRDLSTAPLFQESQLLGAAPHWSPDGKRIVIFDRNYNFMSVIDLQTGERQDIDAIGADGGEYRIDPSGQYLVYPNTVLVGRLFATELWLAKFADHSLQPLNSSDAPPVADSSPTWNPADGTVAVARRYLDGVGPPTSQVYRIDPLTLAVIPLFTEEMYYHTAISWSPDGKRLVMMRRRYDQADPVPGVWVYDQITNTIWQVASNAYLPQWLP